MKKLLLFLSIFYSINVLGQCPITVDQSGPVCYDNCNGWANVTAFGIPPYSYQWSNFSNQPSLVELCWGTYYVTVTDSVGCVSVDSVTIIQLPLLDLIIDTVINAHCWGSSDGEIGVHATGGLPPYSYGWGSLGQNTNYVVGLKAGDYYPEVLDANGCSYSSWTYVNSPSEIITNEILNPTSCSNFYGYINLYAGGGTPWTFSSPYIYQWSTLSNPNYSTLDQIFSLPPDLYTVTITDSIGCSTIETFEINATDGPAPIVIWTNVTCNGADNGAVNQVDITGGIPAYTYLWSTTETTLAHPAPLTPGNYWIKVTDATGCSGFDYFTVTEPSAITNTPFQLNVSCFGDTTGYISLDIQGGSPDQIYPFYNFLWNSGDSTNFIENMPAGIYSVTVTDIMGCTYNEVFNLTSPPLFMVDSILFTNVTCNGFNDGAVGIFVSGGVQPYYYSIDSIYWNQYDTINSLLPNITYHIIAKDDNHCYASSSYFTITEPSLIDITYTQVDPTCIGNNGSIDIVASGGVLPFSIVWDTPGMTTFTETGLMQGLYNATVTDANNCLNELNFTMIQTSSPAVLRGSNSYSGGALPPNEAKIYLFVPSTLGAATMDTLAMTTNSASVWEFTGLLPGVYKIKADLLNPSNYPNLLNTYFDSTYTWEYATAIPLACDDTVDISVKMYEFTLPMTGTGTLTGNVRMVNQNKAVGEPVPGAEILIEQEPNDVPVQCVFSDTAGNYIATNLFTGAEYGIKVDIPGFPLLSTYQNITISENDTVPNLNFLVDTLTNGGIFIDTASYVSNISLNGVKAVIYPNPFVSFINVSVTLEQASNISLELFDALGRKIQTMDEGKLIAGKHEFVLRPTQPVNGSCYLIIHAGNSMLIKKLIATQK